MSLFWPSGQLDGSRANNTQAQRYGTLVAALHSFIVLLNIHMGSIEDQTADYDDGTMNWNLNNKSSVFKSLLMAEDVKNYK